MDKNNMRFVMSLRFLFANHQIIFDCTIHSVFRCAKDHTFAKTPKINKMKLKKKNNSFFFH